ncbi:hypothetical protein COA01_35055 [Bacillus cereus]|uniref:hypothetical protein n=1 Tax=Bacillus cereus TaxID=1396 RepID=UPI000BFCE199|nr:hypothetical protein [Bacillus cereus]PGP12042.1 hypothetical protein COA01_35055 [Bacillus cereus]
MGTKMNYYELKNRKGEYLAVIKAHSGYEAIGYYVIEKNEEAPVPVEDIEMGKIRIPEVSKLRAAGVAYFDLSY